MKHKIIVQGIARNVEWRERADRHKSESKEHTRGDQRQAVDTRSDPPGCLSFFANNSTRFVTGENRSTGTSKTSGVTHSAQDYATVLTFRVEELDDAGNIVQTLSIRTDEEASNWRTSKLHHELDNGDQIRVAGVLNNKGILVPSHIFNLRANVYILGSPKSDKHNLSNGSGKTLGYSTNHIDYLERNYLNELEGKIDGELEEYLIPEIADLEFVKVEGISNFWEQNGHSGQELNNRARDLIAGFNNPSDPLIYFVLGEGANVSVFVGSSAILPSQDDKEEALEDTLDDKSTLSNSKDESGSERAFRDDLPTEQFEKNKIYQKIFRAARDSIVILLSWYFFDVYFEAPRWLFGSLFIGICSFLLLRVLSILFEVVKFPESDTIRSVPSKTSIYPLQANDQEYLSNNDQISSEATTFPLPSLTLVAPESNDIAPEQQMTDQPESGPKSIEPPRTVLLEIDHKIEETAPLISSLRSHYRGIELTKSDQDSISDWQDRLKSLPYVSVVTGTPTVKVNGTGQDQIERLIDGLRGEKWAYLVIAWPVDQRELNSVTRATLRELTDINNTEVSIATSQPIAERYKKALEGFSEKIETGKKSGLWNVATYLLTENVNSQKKANALIRAVMGGEESKPDPVRILDFDGSIEEISGFAQLRTPAPASPGRIQYPFKYLGLLNSLELTALIHLPTREFPGYFVKKNRADFGQHTTNNKNAGNEEIQIGEVLSDGQQVNSQYSIEVNSLARHLFIAGVTGSGKTNSVFHILQQMWDRHVPFLVIEPAKTEYRKLLYSQFGQDLQIFTLGDETVSPFRLNPFEVGRDIRVQTHIDYLRSVFNASFNWYGPTTYILARCLHEIYIDKGWDLVTGNNERGVHTNAQPTLTDLYKKIDEVVDSVLEYKPETKMDIRGALKTRIDSLREGGKGLMLDTRVSIPIETLLQKPTIIELESVGNDNDKAFIIGLLLVTIYEYYSKDLLREGIGLKHLTVVEEAHRLLENIPINTNLEVADGKGEMVRIFTNMLAEMRAYGEGFLIVEQIPNKLSPDVIKNSGTKVLHRVVAADDRQLMGSTMSLTEFQEKHIGTLNVGQAAVFSEGDDDSILVQVPYSKFTSSALTKEEENELIRVSMKSFLDQFSGVYAPLENFIPYEQNLRKVKEAIRIAEVAEFRENIARYILSTVLQGTALLTEFPYIRQSVNKFRKNSHTDDELVRYALIFGIQDYFENMGRYYNLSYDEVEMIRDKFLALIDIACKRCQKPTKRLTKLIVKEEKQIRSFQNKYKSLFQCEEYPFAGCYKVCPNGKCLYRYNVQPLLSDQRLDNNFRNRLTKLSGDEKWRKLEETCQVAVRRTIVDSVVDGEKRKVALCFAVQKAESMNDIDFFLRENVIVNLLNLPPYKSMKME